MWAGCLRATRERDRVHVRLGIFHFDSGSALNGFYERCLSNNASTLEHRIGMRNSTYLAIVESSHRKLRIQCSAIAEALCRTYELGAQPYALALSQRRLDTPDFDSSFLVKLVPVGRRICLPCRLLEGEECLRCVHPHLEEVHHARRRMALGAIHRRPVRNCMSRLFVPATCQVMEIPFRLELPRQLLICHVE